MNRARGGGGWAAAILILVAVVTPAAAQSRAEPGYRQAVVAADHTAASAAGVEILKRGGNVVDAAVATGFALSVVRPASSGIGGGGFMLIWDARRQRAVALDYRERAPAGATRSMYVDPQNPQQVIPGASQHGGLAVAVPGHVAGLCYALREYGTLDLPTVLAPALRLCRDGVPIDSHDRSVQAAVLKSLAAEPEQSRHYGTLRRLYLNQGQAWGESDRFFSPLGPVLERIAAEGAAGFYAGPVAVAMISEVQRAGGILTADDLAAPQVKVREPLQGDWRGQTILTMPPPSSGGTALLESLQVLDAVAARQPQAGIEKLAPDAPLYLHLLAETLKHSFADRSALLGDADFVTVPVARLISRDYAEQLARGIDPSRTQPPEHYGQRGLPDDAGTTHFSILDAAGNAVACTETINTLFGSYVVEPEFGIVLNNEMDDFTSLPGAPNAFGLIQSEANGIEPGKRPLSSMTPTIVIRDGKAQVVVGASGGPRIISATLQVLLRMTRFGQDPVTAVRAPRIHHQWAPDELEVEQSALPLQELAGFGHQTRTRRESAAVQAAGRLPNGQVQGASDPRKGGRPAGF